MMSIPQCEDLVLLDDETLEKEVFRSLSDDYSCIFRVNLRENRVEAYRLSEHIQEKYGDKIHIIDNYCQMMVSYILDHVERNEQEKLIQLLSPERLAMHLRSQKSLLCECHEVRDGRRLCHRIKAARLGQSETDAVIGIVYGLEADNAQGEYHVVSNRLLIVGEPELRAILEEDYQVVFAETTAGALACLESRDEGYAAILIGRDAELLHRLRSDSRFRRIPVIMVSEHGGEAECIRQGASEFFVRPFQPEVVKNRVKSLIHLHDSTALLHMLEKDALTGMYEKEFFYRYAHEARRANPDKSFLLSCVNIENYRMLNEKYGDAVCDMVVRYAAEQIQKQFPGVVAAGRLSDDDFVVMYDDVPFPGREEVLRRIRHEAPVPNLVVKIGTTAVDRETPMRILCDHAQTAIAKIRQIYGVYFAEYNDSMRMEKQREQHIMDSMEKALEQHQFQVYYQPKHLTTTGRPVGAEALVRWIHPEYGFMNPGEFIPLFERIGFIRSLDRYVWVQVFSDIVRWKNEGLPLVPVSINLSRRDFETGDLAEWILNLAARMNIDPELIHIELTESAFIDNPKLISDCLSRLHRARFTIELDDFGAGYSSLTTLNSMDLDVLKIDMSIIRQDVPGSQRNALEFCVELAKMMNLQTVAEGIETEAQCNRVRSLGCDYIQGYYYSKPIPVGEFEAYLARYAAT